MLGGNSINHSQTFPETDKAVTTSQELIRMSMFMC